MDAMNDSEQQLRDAFEREPALRVAFEREPALRDAFERALLLGVRELRARAAPPPSMDGDGDDDSDGDGDDDSDGVATPGMWRIPASAKRGCRELILLDDDDMSDVNPDGSDAERGGEEHDADADALALAIVPAAPPPAPAQLTDEEQLRALLDGLPDPALDVVPMAAGDVVHRWVEAMAHRHVHLLGVTKSLQEMCNFDIVNDVAPAVLLAPSADPADQQPKRSFVFRAPCRGNKTVVIIVAVTLAAKLRRPSLVIVCDQKANIQAVAKRIHDGFVQLTSPDHAALMCDATTLEDLTPEQVARVRDGRLVLVMMAHHHTLQALHGEMARFALEGAISVFDEADALHSTDLTSTSSVRRERLLHRILDVQRVERPRFLRSVLHISATHFPTLKWHSMTRLKFTARFADEDRMRANQYALDDILRAPVDADGAPLYLTASATPKPRRPPATPRLKQGKDETEAEFEARQEASRERAKAAYKAKLDAYDAEVAGDRRMMDDFIRKFAMAREPGRMLMMATTPFIQCGRDDNAMGTVKRAIQVRRGAVSIVLCVCGPLALHCRPATRAPPPAYPLPRAGRRGRVRSAAVYVVCAAAVHRAGGPGHLGRRRTHL